jgi:hypothetical protein
MRHLPDHKRTIRPRHAIRGLAVIAVVAGIALWLGASVATAFQTRPLLSQTGPIEKEGTPLAIAVNNETGHYYVANERSVFNFDPDGALDTALPRLTGGPSNARTVAVDNSGGASAGTIWVGAISQQRVVQYGADGTVTGVILSAASVPPNGTAQAGGLPPVINDGSFRPAAISVDGSGDLYVLDWRSLATATIDKFSPTGTFISQFVPNSELEHAVTIAADADGNMWLRATSGVYEVDSSGKCVEPGCAPTIPGLNLALAVNQRAGTVLVSSSPDGSTGSVSEYDESGTLLGVSGSEVLQNPSAIGVDESQSGIASGRVYVGDAKTRGLFTFGPVTILPDAVTEAATDIVSGQAVLHGQIGAASASAATCVFQYVDEKSFQVDRFAGAPTVPCAPAGPFTGGNLNSVSATAIGLNGGTTYHYRILASNSSGSNPGEDVPFITPGPTVSGTEATAITQVSATLKGTVDPNGSTSSYRFQYLTQSALEANGWVGATEVPADAVNTGLSAAGSGDLSGGPSALGVATLISGGSAIGSGSLSAGGSASGQGNLTANSKEVSALMVSSGSFEVGEPIVGKGIPAGTTIASVASGSLMLSAPATRSESSTILVAGSLVIGSVTANEGQFEVGMPIVGDGLPPGDQIIVRSADGGSLGIVAPAEKSATGVVLGAGSRVARAVLSENGKFEAGMTIAGEGIPAGTTITAVQGGGSSLILSAPAQKSATNTTVVAGSRVVNAVVADEGEFRIGQSVAGPGIAPHTRLVGVTAGGAVLMLSAGAGQAVVGAPLDATEAVSASQVITGLTPGTAYRFRIVASGGGGITEGEEAEFRTQESPFDSLPDGRVYEQATPTQKNAGDAWGEVNAVKASATGGAVTFYSTSGVPGATGAQFYGLYQSNRASDGSGWTTEGLLPDASAGYFARLLGWSEGLQSTYSTARRAGEPPVLYARQRGDLLEPIATGVGDALLQHYVAASAESGEIVFFGTDAVGKTKPGAFVWDKRIGATVPVGILNNGKAPATGTLAGPYDWFTQTPNSANTAGAERQFYTQAENALSQDGRKAFFTEAETDQLYVRINPTGEQPSQPLSAAECRAPANEMACTIEISAPVPGVPDPEQPAAFVGATPNGEQAYFLSAGKLTADATAAAGGRDLYRYDLSDGSLVDLTVDPNTTDTSGADVQGIVGTVGDGSAIYLVANGVLASGARSGSCSPGNLAGECSLYRLAGGQFEFIARLNAGHTGVVEKEQGEFSDNRDWTPTSYLADVTSGSVENASRTAANGNTLLFQSTQQLTKYANHGWPELYLYRPGSQLFCVSCSPTGEAPGGPASLQSIRGRGLAVPTLSFGTLTRSMSEDGTRVFFDSPDALVAGDTNGVEDVYEWEAAGTGSCQSTNQNGGCLFLISTGKSTAPSYFADASADGNDVFFFTQQSLVSQDRDELFDIYDARVGGGIPSQNQPMPSSCNGEGCSGTAGVAPSAPSIGSTAAQSPNPKPKQCKKGFKRQLKQGRSRCVKAQKHRKKPQKHRNAKGKHPHGKHVRKQSGDRKAGGK